MKYIAKLSNFIGGKLKILIHLLIILSFLVGYQPYSYGQTAGAEIGTEQPPASASPRKQLATIIFAGLAGSILGLSTLSFYGRPQDKLANIAIGFALGVVGGFIYVTYTAVEDPNRFYGSPGATGANLESEFLRQQNLQQNYRFYSQSNDPVVAYKYNF